MAKAHDLGETEQQSTRLRMNYEEYLAWAHEDVRAEWKDGEVIIHMTVKKRHQRVVQFVFAVMDLFVRALKLGAVGTAPVEVLLAPGGPSREPDIFFVRHDQLHRWTEDRMAGGPDLAVEVVSDDSVTRDRAEKYHEYEAAGVREYWVIDPRPGRQRAEFYTLDPDGRYQVLAPEDGIIRSRVLPGFALRLEWLWQDPSANPLVALSAMGQENPALIAALQGSLGGTANTKHDGGLSSAALECPRGKVEHAASCRRHHGIAVGLGDDGARHADT